MGFIDSALQGFGESMFSVGENFLTAGYKFWKSCSNITLDYVKKNPMAQSHAWGTVTGSIYTMSLAIAGSLAVLFFVMGWLRESIDIRNNFSLENMMRFFIRLIITTSLIVNSLSIVTSIVTCSVAITSSVSVSIDNGKMDGIFDDLRETMEEDDTGGLGWIGMGIGGMIGGIIGGLVIIVCGIQLVLAVLSRLFKLLLCIPFAPPAFATFAGGAGLSRTGEAWIKTFLGYALEAVVISLAISISFGLFKDNTLFPKNKEADFVSLILYICQYCVPMITACACVKSADTVVSRCLGLN